MHYAELRQVREELTGPGGQFEIVEEEILGNRIKTFKAAPPSVREFWLSTVAWGDRPYLIYEGEVTTYAQAHAQVNALAAWLETQGVRPGDRVAIAMRNYPEWLIAYWACLSTGVAAVGMNAWWTAEELDYALKDSQPKVLIADAERLARYRELVPHGIKLVGVRLADYPADVIPWSEIIAAGGAMPQVAVDPDADACIFYTSGTTGFPKGAQLTHRGCIANLMNMLYSTTAQALATERATGIAPPAEAPIPVSLLTTPLFHVTANNCGAYLTSAAGGAIVLMYKWDAGEALKLIEKYGITGVSGVPIMAREIINHPDFAKTDTSTLSGLSGGGAQVPPEQVGEIHRKIPAASPTTGYGMTETCGIITSVAGPYFIDRPDSAGPYMPSFDAKVVDDAGNELPQGEVGELWVRGSPVIKGYLNRPDATAETITQGWLHTGDIARIDADGFVYIVDRKKDLVIRGGENISCTEVEACIYRHPAVAECSVFGVKDERMGEEIGVAVYLKEGHALDETDLKKHCLDHMSKHKVPRHVWFLPDPLPRNASGKFLRRELKEHLSKLVEEA
ncbi:MULTISPECIES: class I adenylate-forming enzyme family protein [unclassified Novosphingobium]|uniref:class I adenylate-forming enzyme family protein n=1 Tax=unclassified Novosphingobium TaxID=2644732 RepID=UPI000EDA4350|nr:MULTISPECIES: class I adenylate-forming enzyme family protein [unclassified Novosphingobium]HCF24721.1 AMP-dependent synthetase [Novosphingobium sp.]HQV02070.1 class I adenylate-forming enzyme family protein [Novosphingobium sp.]